jgi:peptide/nickel transport system permease protein
MLRFLTRRLSAALITAWIAASVAFVMLRLLPGDALAARLAQGGATAAQIAERREALGLDQPVAMQYISLIGGLLRFDLGHSLITGRPVSEMIGEQLQPTLMLAAGGACVGLVLGLLLGIAAGAGQGRVVRGGALLTATLLLSSPIYWTGTLLIYVVSVQMRLLPSTGSSDDVRFLILPWLALGLALAGSVARLTAASLEAYRDADFIRTARAKGLPERHVLWRHMLRPGLGPVIALVGLQTGFLLGGAVVTEMIFVRPGLGQVLLAAVNDRDFPVVQGLVILSAILYSAVGAAADLIAALLDPRIRAEPDAA